MRIIIIEDEPPIARLIGECCQAILGRRLRQLDTFFTLKKAEAHLAQNRADICLLDLNLGGQDGFEILRQAVSQSFHTIIISAHAERALEAFEYGVLDFVPKPFTEERLRKALHRCLDSCREVPTAARYLVIRKSGRNQILPVENVLYIKAARYLAEIYTTEGRMEFLDKPLHRLEKILPMSFFRIHRSVIISLTQLESYCHIGNGAYQVRLKDGTTLALGRHRVRLLRSLLGV